MIVTITPSPAIDWTVTVDSFELDAVNRIVADTKEASGKGLNVSWALHRAGVETAAVFPAGGATAEFMRNKLSAAGIPNYIIDTGLDVRTNITLVSPGHSTKINEAGTPLSPAQVEQLHQTILSACAGAEVALLCGSLPPGLPPEFAVDVVNELTKIGVPCVVDTSREPLRAALSARPAMIKPNVDELAELVGLKITTLGEVEKAAKMAIELGAQSVLASMGADGAMFISPEHSIVAKAQGIPFVNAVGAGDALLAGFMAGGPSDEDRIANAVLFASSAVATESTLFPIRTEFADSISVTDNWDRGDKLTEPAFSLS